MATANVSNKLSAFVVGYTGETGKELVKALSASDMVEKVVLIGRRQTDLAPEVDRSRFESVVVDFDNLENFSECLSGLKAGFCCLGTTRAKSGKEGFIRVDHDYVMKVAEVARAQGVTQFHLVSSVGANKNSWFLYPRIKGQVEENLGNLGFERLRVYRPKLLTYEHSRSDSRPLEKVGITLCRPIAHFWPTSIITPTSVLGRAMVNAALVENGPASLIYENKEIFRLAGAL